MSRGQPPAAAEAPATVQADPWLRRWARRCVTIPSLIALFLAVSLLFPLFVAASAVADLLRRGGSGSGTWLWTRTTLFAILYLVCEIVGLAASLFLWLGSGVWAGGSRRRFLDWNFRLQCWWGRTLALGGAALFDVRFEVDGEESLEQRPFFLFLRHTSIADTLLALLLLSAEHGIVLRYVLKRPLLWDPCLDVVGNRLTNAFVYRSGASARDIAAVARLADDLGPGEGVLLYPEGTRFSAAKRRRALERLERGDDHDFYRAVRDLRHVLPPRLGGPLALLERNAENARNGATGADVVFCSHAGFEGAASLSELGSLIGRTVRIRFWRVPFPHLPRSTAARKRWLVEHWRRVDEHAESHRGDKDLESEAAALRIT